MCVERPLVLFDYCDTLYRGNTTLAFIRYVCVDDPLDLRWGAVRYGYWRMMAALCRRLMPTMAPWQHMALRIRSLRGLPDSMLKKSAMQFHRQVLCHNALPTLNIFRQRYEAGDSVGVISFTLSILLESFAQDYPNIKIMGNTLEYIRGQCSGRYACMLQKIGKWEAIQEHYSEQELYNATYYTDDAIADVDLVSRVKNVYIVATNGLSV